MKDKLAIAQSCHRSGDYAGAEAAYLELFSDGQDVSAELSYSFGMLLAQTGRAETGLPHIEAALAQDPTNPTIRRNLAIVQLQLGRPEAAAVNFETLARTSPDDVGLWLGLAQSLSALGMLDGAATAWERALSLQSGHPDMHNDYGIILARQGRTDRAAEAFRRAVRITPDHAGYWFNLGHALHDLGRLGEAVEAYAEATKLDGRHASAHLNKGAALVKLGRVDEAIGSYRLAVELMPGNAKAHLNLCKALIKTGRLPEALAACNQALALAPNDAEAWSERIYLRKYLCDWAGIEQDEDACRSLVLAGAHGVDPGVFMMMTGSSAEQLQCTRLWQESLAGPSPSRVENVSPAAQGRIRIGYLSTDLRNHAVGRLVLDLLARHDRDRFEVFAYSTGADDGSPIRQQLISAVDHFVDAHAMPDEQVAAKIAVDGIHILVDLTGHSAGGRMGIPARRPAPIQVNWLGYPGTAGAGFMDYILADPVGLPMIEQPFFTERIVHLPDTYIPYGLDLDTAAPPPSRRECGLPEDAFIFCAFHSPQKIRRDVFHSWMRLLGRIEGSVLWLLAPSEGARVNLVSEARLSGIDAGRLVFAPKADISRYLARHRVADLFLDALPYNAHGSAADSLLMGLPLVTCMGETFPGRVAAGLLRAVELPELIATSLAEYEELAANLASHPEKLAEIRRKLLEVRDSAKLFDRPRFTASIEKAYLRMAEIWQSGQDPRSFSV